jgi:hypothetical protein
MSSFDDEMAGVALEMAGIFGDAGTYLGPGLTGDGTAVSVIVDGEETFEETDGNGVRSRTVARLRVLKSEGLSLELDGVITVGGVGYVVQELKDLPGLIGVEGVRLVDVERGARGTRG